MCAPGDRRTCCQAEQVSPLHLHRMQKAGHGCTAGSPSCLPPQRTKHGEAQLHGQKPTCSYSGSGTCSSISPGGLRCSTASARQRPSDPATCGLTALPICCKVGWGRGVRKWAGAHAGVQGGARRRPPPLLRRAASCSSLPCRRSLRMHASVGAARGWRSALTQHTACKAWQAHQPSTAGRRSITHACTRLVALRQVGVADEA